MTVSTPIAVRPATLNDIPQILAIEQLASSAAHWSTDQYRQLVNEGAVFVGEQEAALRGFVCTKRGAGEWEIENVVVAPPFLRRGIAHQLLSEVVRRAGNDGASAVLLEVRESNYSARALYEKLKFSEIGRRPRYYSNPSEDAILYALRFRP